MKNSVIGEKPKEYGNQYSNMLVESNQLKPGYVLNQDITGTISYRRGYVLSAPDIEKIRSQSGLEKIEVLVSKRDDTDKTLERINQALGKADTTPLPTSAVQSSASISGGFIPQLDEKQRLSAIVSQQYDEHLEKIVEHKKKKIRGEQYEERLELKKNQQFQKVEDVFKTMQVSKKKDAMKVIEHYAQASLDLDGINQIDSVKTDDMAKRLDNYEVQAEIYLNAALTQKQVYTSFVKDIVVNLLTDIGGKLSSALFSSLAKVENFSNYLTAHSIHVMLVAVTTAIELTRVINGKADQLSTKDFNTYLSISKKTFTIEELINLGVAAMLHDIDIKKHLPELSPGDKLSLQQESIINLHTSNGYHIAKMINIEFDVQQAIYQHHERFDLSGYPKGLAPRYFTKYTPLLMFAEHYVEMTTENPFNEKVYTPREAIVCILTQERMKFDGDVIYSFLKFASLYPIGTWVGLSDGHFGVVSDAHSEQIERPIVKIFFDRAFKRIEPNLLDLARSDVRIVKPIPVNSVRQMAGGSLDFLYT